MKMKRVLTAMGLMVALLAGCGTNHMQGDSGNEQACVQGEVTEVNPNESTDKQPEEEKQSDTDPNQTVSSDEAGGNASSRKNFIGSIFVKGEKESDQFDISVEDQTKIVRQSGEALEFADITEGAKVEVYCTGGIMESFPAKATAGKIIVND